MIQNGTVIRGTYEVVGLIGSGGSGNVYACRSAVGRRRERTSDIRWAIKEAHTKTEAELSARTENRASESLRMEVELLKEMKHESLVKVVDVIRSDSGLLMVMDYVSGKPLDLVIRERGALTEKEVVRIGLQIADVLGYLHSRGQAVIYRDLKPSNLILCEDSRVVLVDFGTVFTASSDFPIMKLAFGTRGYAAPEQYRESAVPDAAMDVYAFGRTLTALLTGGSTRLSNLRRVSPALKRILRRCTRKKKEERYASISEVYHALKKLSEENLLRRMLVSIKLFVFTGAAISAIVFSINAMTNAEAHRYLALALSLMAVFIWYVWQIPDLILSLAGVTTRKKIQRQKESARINGTFHLDTQGGTGQALSWEDIEISLDDETTDLRIDIDNNRVQYAGMEDFVMERDEVITKRENYKAVI